jgi:hypothetical protein
MDSIISKEEKDATTLINILGRKYPSLKIIQEVKNIIIKNNEPEIILEKTLETIMFRFDLKSDIKFNALDFLTKIKKIFVKGKKNTENLPFIYQSLMDKLPEIIDKRKNRVSYENLAIKYGVCTPTIRKFCSLNLIDEQALKIRLEEKPIFIPLKLQKFNEFKNGTRKYELRVGERWGIVNCPIGRKIILSKGYGNHERLNAVVTGHQSVNIDDLSFKERRDILNIYGSVNTVYEIGIEVKK